MILSDYPHIHPYDVYDLLSENVREFKFINEKVVEAFDYPDGHYEYDREVVVVDGVKHVITTDCAYKSHTFDELIPRS